MAQAKRSLKDSAPKQFRHPIAGVARRIADYIAVFWREGASRDAREALIKQHGLELAELGAKQPSMLKVNQTDRLSWLRGADGKAISDEVVAKLAESDLVEWVSPGFRSERDRGENTSAFHGSIRCDCTAEQAFAQAGGAAALTAGVSLDTARSRRMHNLVALNVPEMNAIAVAEQMQGALNQSGGGDIRYETIPFISPVCDTVNCKPPYADLTPDDPMFAQQWGLQRIGVPRAWQITRGSPDVTVAVIDEGVQLDHPDLDCTAVVERVDRHARRQPDRQPRHRLRGIAAARVSTTARGRGRGRRRARSWRSPPPPGPTWTSPKASTSRPTTARACQHELRRVPVVGIWDFDLIRDALQHAHDQGLLLMAASGNEDAPASPLPGQRRPHAVRRRQQPQRRAQADRRRLERELVGRQLRPRRRRGRAVPGDADHRPARRRRLRGGDYTSGSTAPRPPRRRSPALAALIFSLRPSLTDVEVRSIIESTCDKISPALYAYAQRRRQAERDVARTRSATAASMPSGRCWRALRDAPTRTGVECRGCGGDCGEDTPESVSGPSPVPWLTRPVQ